MPCHSCASGSIADYYRNGTGYYYLNNFENILNSAVTLFELTVVNNWYVIMEAYCQVFSEWARLFFMLFYLNMMILMYTVVSFILGAFMFRMQYTGRHMANGADDHAWVYEEAEVNALEKSIFWTPFSVGIKKRAMRKLRYSTRRRCESVLPDKLSNKEHHESDSVLRRLQAVYSPDRGSVRSKCEPHYVQHRARNSQRHASSSISDSAATCKYRGTRKILPFEFNLEMNEAELKPWLNEVQFFKGLNCATRRKSNAAAAQMRVFQTANPFWTSKPSWSTLRQETSTYLRKKAHELVELDKQVKQVISNSEDFSARPQV